MKKLLAILLALVLCIGIIPISLGETSFDSQTIYSYVGYLKMLIPADLQKMELTDEEWDYGYVLRYESADANTVFTYANYEISNTSSLDSYGKFLKDQENAENLEKITANGKEALYFEKEGNSFYVGMYLGENGFDELGITLNSEQNITKDQAKAYVKEIFASMEEVKLDLSNIENINIDYEKSYEGVWYDDQIIGKQYYMPKDYIEKPLSENMLDAGYTCSFYAPDNSQFYTTLFVEYEYEIAPLDTYFTMLAMGYTDIEPMMINDDIVMFGRLKNDIDLIYVEDDNGNAKEYTFTTTPDSEANIEAGVKLLSTIYASFKNSDN